MRRSVLLLIAVLAGCAFPSAASAAFVKGGATYGGTTNQTVIEAFGPEAAAAKLNRSGTKIALLTFLEQAQCSAGQPRMLPSTLTDVAVRRNGTIKTFIRAGSVKLADGGTRSYPKTPVTGRLTKTSLTVRYRGAYTDSDPSGKQVDSCKSDVTVKLKRNTLSGIFGVDQGGFPAVVEPAGSGVAALRVQLHFSGCAPGSVGLFGSIRLTKLADAGGGTYTVDETVQYVSGKGNNVTVRATGSIARSGKKATASLDAVLNVSAPDGSALATDCHNTPALSFTAKGA